MIDVAIWIAGDELTEYERTIVQLLHARVSIADLFVTRAPKSDGNGNYPAQSPVFRSRANTVRFAAAARDAGLRVRLTTWLMPHESYIRELADELEGLMADTSAEALTLDTENHWNKATGAQSYADAAAQVGRELGQHPLIMSSYGWVDPVKLDELSRVCPMWGPQAYAHEGEGNSEVDPATVVSDSMSRWRRNLPGDGPTQGWDGVAAAAFEQAADPYPGMSATVTDARHNGLRTLSYWSADSLRRADVTAVIAGVRRSRGPRLLDIETMPSSVRDDGVESLQLRLTQLGFEPGPVDGQPGKRTLEALQRFQTMRGLAADGVLWPASHAELFGE